MSGMLERHGRLRRRVALAISLLLNVVFLVALRFGTLPREHEALSRTQRALQVRLIDVPQAIVAPPISSASPLAPSPPLKQERYTPRIERATRAKATPDNSRPDSTTAPVARALELFDANGRVLIPNVAAASADFPSRPTNADAFARRNPLPYAPTRFESVWAPRNETLGEELLRKTVVTHTWRTPWGTQVSCSTSLLLGGILGGCGWGFVPIATGEELQRMRADPPAPREGAGGGDAAEKSTGP